MKKILLGDQILNLSKTDLPMLIHGADGTGASLFSISAVANLYAQGHKLLFTSGFHMARDEFREQTGITDEAILVEEASDIERAHTKRIVFVPRERADLFDKLAATLPDIAERIVFLKNFDLFDESHFAAVEKMENLVLAGDLDKCTYKDRVLGKSWQARIYFSPVENDDTPLPELPKYHGWLASAAHNGVVSLGD